MAFELVEESKFAPIKENKFEPVDLLEQKSVPVLERGEAGTTVNLDTFGNKIDLGIINIGKKEEFSLSSPEQKQNWMVEGDIGWWEYASKTKGRDIYYGDTIETTKLWNLSQRLQKNEYKADADRMKDMDELKTFMYEQEEMSTRGLSWGTQVYRIAAQIPAFALEMALTGGIATAARKTTAKVGTKIVGEIAKKTLLRKGVEVLGREAIVGAARTTVMPHRYMSGYAQRKLNDVISITDKGIEILDESQEKPIVTFMKAYGDSFVEFYTETLGGKLLQPMGRVVGKGILSRMPAASKASFEKMARTFAAKIPKGRVTELFRIGGFDGIVEEYGEERLGALFRIPLGLDEREIPTLDKLQEAIFPGWQQSLIEIGAFGIWGGISASSQIISNHLLGKGRLQEDVDKVLSNLSEKEKDKLAVKLGETYEIESKNARIVIKAVSGEELTPEERTTLDTLHADFVKKGLIVEKEIEEAPTGEGKGTAGKEGITEFQDRVTAAQKLTTTAKEQKYRIPINADGSITIYHGTSVESAKIINTSGKIESQSFFSPNKKGAEFYGKTKNKTGEILPIKVDARDIEYSTGTGEIYAPNGLVKDTDEIWKSPDRVKLSQPTGEGKVISTSQQKANEVIKADMEERVKADVEKQIKLLYQGREKQLDQRRLAIEREMKLLEKQERIKSNQNKLDKLSKELESIHYQIADLEDTGIERLEKEGITIKGEELERLRKKAFRQGEIALRKDLMAKARETREDRQKKEKAVKIILKQPKKPENIVDVKYQSKINALLDKLGDKKQSRKKALNTMTPNELDALANTIAELKIKGREVFQSKKEQKKIASEIMRASLIKQAGGTKGEMFAKGSVEEKKARRSNLLKVYDIVTLRPLRMIRRLFGDIGEKLIYNSIDTADLQRGLFSWQRKKQIEASMKKNEVTLFTLGSLVEINGKSYQVNNILRMYLATKDEKSYKALIYGNNITESEVNEFIDVVKKDHPKYIKFADEVQAIVANRTDEYAETVEIYFNVEMERVDVYFPLRRIAKGGLSQNELNQDLETEMIIEQILRKGAGFSYTSADKKNTYSRVEIADKYQPEISLDFIGDAIRIIEKQEHLIAYAPLQKAFNKIVDDADLQDAVKYNHGQAAWKWVNEYLSHNINPDLMFQGGSWIERFIGRSLKPVRLGLSKAYLGFNTVTAGKQLPSLTLALKYTTPQAMAISMDRILFSSKAREEVYRLDPSLKNRVVSRDFEDLLREIESLPESDIKRALLIASKAVDKKAFVMIMGMDRYAVLSVYDSVYRYQRQTKSEEEAKDIAHKAVIETQPQGGMKDLPALYRTNNEFLRMMLMFTNQLNQIWNMARADMPREISKGQYARATTGIASIIISSSLIYIMSHGRLPEDPDDFFDAIFGSLVSSIPIAGNWGMAMVRGYDPSISPAASLRNNLKFMINDVQNEEYMEALEKSLFSIAVLTQMPYSQPRRTIKGIHDLVTGETDDFRRLLWSEFMLENQ